MFIIIPHFHCPFLFSVMSVITGTYTLPYPGFQSTLGTAPCHQIF